MAWSFRRVLLAWGRERRFKYRRIFIANIGRPRKGDGVLVQSTREAGLSHRGRLDIIASILSSSVGGARKTSIMYRCNLSFKQLESYLGFLLSKELLRVFNGVEREASQFFETTSRGLDFVRAYENLDALMSV